MKSIGRKKTFCRITWTKAITAILLFIGVICGIMPFILAFCGKEPCPEMGIAWVTEIVAVSLGYFVRGFKDSKAESDAEIEMMKLGGECDE